MAHLQKLSNEFGDSLGCRVSDCAWTEDPSKLVFELGSLAVADQVQRLNDSVAAISSYPADTAEMTGGLLTLVNHLDLGTRFAAGQDLPGTDALDGKIFSRLIASLTQMQRRALAAWIIEASKVGSGFGEWSRVEIEDKVSRIHPWLLQA